MIGCIKSIYLVVCCLLYYVKWLDCINCNQICDNFTCLISCILNRYSQVSLLCMLQLCIEAVAEYQFIQQALWENKLQELTKWITNRNMLTVKICTIVFSMNSHRFIFNSKLCSRVYYQFSVTSYCRELGSIQEHGSHSFSALLIIPSSNDFDERSPRPNYPKGRNLPTGEYSTTTRLSRNGAWFSQVQIVQW